jgi:hypothetical protein
MILAGEGAVTGIGRIASLRQDDLLAPDLVRADADQCLAVRAIDRRLTRDRDAEIAIAAGKSRLLERNETAACRVRAPNRQIPFGRRRFVIAERNCFCDEAFRSFEGRRRRPVRVRRLSGSPPMSCRDMNEDVLSAVRRLNEAVAFGRVEPFHIADSHYHLLN